MGGSASTSKSLAVAPLVEAVKSGGDEDKQKAARIVADFVESEQNCEQLLSAGGVAPLLLLLDLSTSTVVCFGVPSPPAVSVFPPAP